MGVSYEKDAKAAAAKDGTVLVTIDLYAPSPAAAKAIGGQRPRQFSEPVPPALAREIERAVRPIIERYREEQERAADTPPAGEGVSS